MEHRPPPPPPTGNHYNFGDFSFSPIQDLTGSQQAATDPDVLPGTMTDGFQMDGDILSVLDSTMLDNFPGMPMTLDSTNDNSLTPDFNPDHSGSLPENAIALAENQFNTAANNVPGAGPLPVAPIGALPAGGANSTLTEFTKRRNWPAKVVEELKDLLMILDANGRIKYSSPSISQVSSYTTEEVNDVFLKELIHPDDQGIFVSELNESIASGNPLRIFFRFKRKEGTYTIVETIGHAHIAAAKFAPNPNNQSPFCQAVFIMARPYPTKNAGLLDSFLEHKIENERLKRRISELRREEEADADEAQRYWAQSQASQSDLATTEDSRLGVNYNMSNIGTIGTVGEATMAQPDGAFNAGLTRENLEGAAGKSRQDSLNDKMARYDGGYTDTIEMLTGLRYVEGERSRGLTTGNASPTLIKGDAGIAIPLDRDPRTGEKKKKLKTSEEYVCTDCGTLESPEWRKGPNGPKTLCNACGLRWAKKEKRRQSTMPSTVHMGDHNM